MNNGGYEKNTVQTGLEPATSRILVERANQLRYRTLWHVALVQTNRQVGVIIKLNCVFFLACVHG